MNVTDGATVVIDSTGHLGTTSSSRRYKENIQNRGASSDNVLRPRPVTFRYKQSDLNGEKPLDYGLVAEEVAEIYPELVVRNHPLEELKLSKPPLSSQLK